MRDEGEQMSFLSNKQFLWGVAVGVFIGWCWWSTGMETVRGVMGGFGIGGFLGGQSGGFSAGGYRGGGPGWGRI
jgi:hypothetical protein